MRGFQLIVFAWVLGTGTACTAAKATYHIVAAEQSLNRAAEHGASDLAVYEYTMAVRYLEKAREEAGFADYRVCEELAKKSAEWADKAIISIEQRGRRGVEVDLDDLEDLELQDATPPPLPPTDPLPAPVDDDGLWDEEDE